MHDHIPLIALMQTAQLPLSLRTREFLESNGVNQLNELFALPFEDWFALPGFSQQILDELMSLFVREQLVDYIVD